MFIAFGIMVSCLCGYVQSQTCDFNLRCGPHLNSIPDCETELQNNPLYKCVVDILSDCHAAPLQFQLNNIKLARDIFCQDKSLAASFKNNIECWSLMKTCIGNFGEAMMQIEQNATNKEVICKEMKATRDVCTSHALDQCRDMVTTYINIAHDKMICKPDFASAAHEQLNNAMNRAQNIATFSILLLFVYVV